MKKILISDYDKTLYKDDESIKINVEKIKEYRNAGNIFVIATGRSYTSIKDEIEKYSIEYDYIILSHGTVILNKNNELVLSYEIKKEIIEKILKACTKFNDVIETTSLLDTFRKGVDITAENLTKISYITKTIEDAKKLANYINEEFGKEVKAYAIDMPNHKYTEVISVDTDKGKAIEKLLEIKNIDETNVYTIGDGSNDVEMIEKYNGFGMTNSEQCVLDITNKLYDNVYNLIEDILNYEQ